MQKTRRGIRLVIVCLLAMMCALPSCLFCSFNNRAVAKANNELKLHFIDVGQGDCIFVELPDGKNMIATI